MGPLTKDLLLYAVTDRSYLQGCSLLQACEAALAGGVSMLQLREKDLAPELFEQEATELELLCRRYNVPLIINDDVQLAAKTAAAGVHVGQSDMAVAEARRLLGDQATIGASVLTVAQALEAEAQGADYLGVGAIFPTATKLDAAVVTLTELAAICNAVQIPVVAIGGIGASNISQLAGSGIAGVALVSAIFAVPDITAQCRRLRIVALNAVRPVQGVVFDMDGTLLDSMPYWADVGNCYLESQGFQRIPDLNERFLKMSLEEAASYFKDVIGVPGSVEEIAGGVNTCVEDTYRKHAHLKPGVRELLEQLQSRGVRQCICTATDRHLIEAVLQRLNIAEYFCGIVTIAETGYNKRGPEIFEVARQMLGTPLEHTWVVEDALHALQAASRGGFATVGVFDEAFADDQQAIIAASDAYLVDMAEWGF